MKQIIKLLVVIGVLIVSPMHLLASSYVPGQLIIKPTGVKTDE